MRSLLNSDDVVWNLPGNSVISGKACGAEAVVRRARSIVSYGLTFTLRHILFGEEGVALSLHNTARRRDQALDEHLATVCKMRDGKIGAIDTYLSDVDMVDAFFVEQGRDSRCRWAVRDYHEGDFGASVLTGSAALREEAMSNEARIQELFDRFRPDSSPEEICPRLPNSCSSRGRWEECRMQHQIDRSSRSMTRPGSTGPAPPPEAKPMAVHRRVRRRGRPRSRRHGGRLQGEGSPAESPAAIKMTPRAPSAAPEDHARFCREAEAVAALRHPNIVQIHDVGEIAGRRYFTMEFFEGGQSLATAGRSAANRYAASRAESRRVDRDSCLRRPVATRSGSSIATSNRRTSSSPRTASPKSSTSAWPGRSMRSHSR